MLLSTSAYAQRNDTEEWNRLIIQKKLTSDGQYILAMEFQQRFADNVSKNERYVLRPSISYAPDKFLSYTLGYAWIDLSLDAKYHSSSREEHRPWEQVQYRTDYGKMQMQFRFRQEQRLFSDSKQTSHRSRFQSGFSLPLAEDKSYGIGSTQELFLNLNSIEKGPQSGYDRTRVFIGPFLQFDNIRYDIGYVGEHVHRFGGQTAIVHALAVFIGINF